MRGEIFPLLRDDGKPVEIDETYIGGKETDFVRAVIQEVQPQGVVLGINGQSPASRPLETSSSEINRFSPIPA